jgi:hypothetical protein
MNEQDYDLIADIVLEICADAENYMTFRAVATPVLTEIGLTIEEINNTLRGVWADKNAYANK